MSGYQRDRDRWGASARGEGTACAGTARALSVRAACGGAAAVGGAGPVGAEVGEPAVDQRREPEAGPPLSARAVECAGG